MLVSLKMSTGLKAKKMGPAPAMRNELLETPVELANASSVEPPDPPIRKPKLKETSCTATVLLAGEAPTVLAKLSLLTSTHFCSPQHDGRTHRGAGSSDMRPPRSGAGAG